MASTHIYEIENLARMGSKQACFGYIYHIKTLTKDFGHRGQIYKRLKRNFSWLVRRDGAFRAESSMCKIVLKLRRLERRADLSC